MDYEGYYSVGTGTIGGEIEVIPEGVIDLKTEEESGDKIELDNGVVAGEVIIEVDFCGSAEGVCGILLGLSGGGFCGKLSLLPGSVDDFGKGLEFEFEVGKGPWVMGGPGISEDCEGGLETNIVVLVRGDDEAPEMLEGILTLLDTVVFVWSSCTQKYRLGRHSCK